MKKSLNRKYLSAGIYARNWSILQAQILLMGTSTIVNDLVLRAFLRQQNMLDIGKYVRSNRHEKTCITGQALCS